KLEAPESDSSESSLFSDLEPFLFFRLFALCFLNTMPNRLPTSSSSVLNSAIVL
ncbi:5760_t:CDS:1, partial [Funneliformis caledonium]